MLINLVQLRLTFSSNKVSLEPDFDVSLGLPGNSYKYLSIIRARASGGGDVQQTGGGDGCSRLGPAAH